MCVCASHRWLFRSTFIFPLSLLVKPEPAYARCIRSQTWRIFTRLLQPRFANSRDMNSATSSRCAGPYSGCSGWVCRPFSGRVTLWCSQKALCSWSSSDIRGRPMSKCIFRFSSHSSSLEKAGRLSASRSQHTAAIGKKAGGQSEGQ